MEEKKEFEIAEVDVDEQNAEKSNQKVRCWVGTWNHPKMTDEEFLKALTEMYVAGHLKYAVFQREKGEESGIIHFQFFLDFKNAKHFNWLKEHLPYGCHFKPMRSTKTACRDYCSKVDTRVSGYYEIGEFVEERQRTDLLKIIELLKMKVPFEEVQEIYPSQCIMYKRQLSEYAQSVVEKEYSRCLRDIKVTYVYGPPGSGKTSFMFNELGFDNTYCVDIYDKSMFTNYSSQKNLVLDEFVGKIEITYLNKLLDRYPVQLRGLGTVKFACYDTVFMISNLPLSKQYKDVQEHDPEIYKAFCRRIGRIIRFDSFGNKFIEKDIYNNSIQLSIEKVADLSDDELLF